MNLIVELTPSEEAQISAAAKETGLAPAEFVKKLVKEHLPASPDNDEGGIDVKLPNRQEQGCTPRMPDVSTQALFAQWAEEDARLTAEEQAENERIYAEIEKNGISRVKI